GDRPGRGYGEGDWAPPRGPRIGRYDVMLSSHQPRTGGQSRRNPSARSSSLTVIDRQRQTHRSLVLAALVVAMFLAAIEGTIVATAMPSIAARLGGFSLYSWVFSSYLLMQAVTTPVFGKLADLYGRKPVFI